MIYSLHWKIMVRLSVNGVWCCLSFSSISSNAFFIRLSAVIFFIDIIYRLPYYRSFLFRQHRYLCLFIKFCYLIFSACFFWLSHSLIQTLFIFRRFPLRCRCWHWHLFRLIDGMQSAFHFVMFQRMDVLGSQLGWYGLQHWCRVSGQSLFTLENFSIFNTLLLSVLISSFCTPIQTKTCTWQT